MPSPVPCCDGSWASSWLDRNVLVNVSTGGRRYSVGWPPALVHPLQPGVSSLLGVGFCGSLTTFSSWMLDTARLLGEGRWGAALGLLALTLGLGLGAAWLGLDRRCGVAARVGDPPDPIGVLTQPALRAASMAPVSSALSGATPLL